MANTTWKQVVYDVADGIRTLLGTSSTIPVGELKGKLTGITRKSAATYTPSTSAQTITAGQYLAGDQTITAMPSGALSDVSVSSSGLITQQVGTSGYLASGTSKTKQLTTQAAKTITPSTSSQTAAASGVYTTGAVTVAAVPTETKTVTPTSKVQTITPSSGKFLSSVTIKAADISSVDITNGIIKEYCAATEDISAGTFIEFINGGLPSTFGSGTIIDTTQETGWEIEAVKLSENKVLILYRYDNNNYYLYGVVCTISGTTITKGTITAFEKSTFTGYEICAVALSENKVLIAHPLSNNCFLSAVVCTISGTTITVGAEYTLDTTEQAGIGISVAKLSESKVFISYSLDDYDYLYGIVCTISGTTITKGTKVQLINRTWSGLTKYVVTLTEDKVLILHNYSSSSRYLYGLVCTISGTTITAGTSTSLIQNEYASANISAIALDENSVFVAHGYGKYTQYLYGSIVNISGTTPTLGVSIALSSNYNSAKGISIIRITDNIIFITHAQSSTYYYLDYTIVQLTGSTITRLQQGTLIESQYAGGGSNSDNRYEASSVLVSDDAIVVAYNTGLDYTVNAMVVKLTQTTIQTATDYINIGGLTRTQATTTTAGEVWVLA